VQWAVNGKTLLCDGCVCYINHTVFQLWVIFSAVFDSVLLIHIIIFNTAVISCCSDCMSHGYFFSRLCYDMSDSLIKTTTRLCCTTCDWLNNATWPPLWKLIELLCPTSPHNSWWTGILFCCTSHLEHITCRHSFWVRHYSCQEQSRDVLFQTRLWLLLGQKTLIFKLSHSSWIYNVLLGLTKTTVKCVGWKKPTILRQVCRCQLV